MQDVGQHEKPRKWIGCLWWFLGVSLFFILLFLWLAGPNILNTKRSSWEKWAKASLRAYGEKQLTYQSSNEGLLYGSWEELRKSGYIDRHYNRANCIEMYSVWTNVYRPSPFAGVDTEGYDSSQHGFIAVAFPRTTLPPGYLATFAIHEDQVLREYRPEKEGNKPWDKADEGSARTWERIR